MADDVLNDNLISNVISLNENIYNISSMVSF